MKHWKMKKTLTESTVDCNIKNTKEGMNEVNNNRIKFWIVDWRNEGCMIRLKNSKFKRMNEWNIIELNIKKINE